MLAYGEAFLGRNDQNIVLRRSRDNDITTAVEVDVGDVPTGPSIGSHFKGTFAHI